MLEQLFGSRTRLKILKIFLLRRQKKYYVRELTRLADEHINSVRRELAHLEALDILTSETIDKKKFYTVRGDSLLYPELRALLYKARLTTEKVFVDHVKALGTVSFLALLGMFTDSEASDSQAPTDIFLVGNVHRGKLDALLHMLQPDFDRQIYYTIMTPQEFQYRIDITDKFVFDILRSKKIVIIDTLNVQDQHG